MELCDLTPRALARLIDNTLLAPTATEADWQALCAQSRDYHFKSVAVNPAGVALCRGFLQGSDVAVDAAVAFPLGQTTRRIKLLETSDALEAGAQEIDYVLTVGKVKERDRAFLADEMRQIVDLCRQAGAISKVILETAYLTDGEIAFVCDIAREVRPDFVKTSTGFGPAGATADHVALMKRCVGDGVAVKAAGGIRTLDDALAMLAAGATRLGTSRGKQLVDELTSRLEGRETV